VGGWGGGSGNDEQELQSCSSGPAFAFGWRSVHTTGQNRVETSSQPIEFEPPCPPPPPFPRAAHMCASSGGITHYLSLDMDATLTPFFFSSSIPIPSAGAEGAAGVIERRRGEPPSSPRGVSLTGRMGERSSPSYHEYIGRDGAEALRQQASRLSQMQILRVEAAHARRRIHAFNLVITELETLPAGQECYSAASLTAFEQVLPTDVLPAHGWIEPEPHDPTALGPDILRYEDVGQVMLRTTKEEEINRLREQIKREEAIVAEWTDMERTDSILRGSGRVPDAQRK